MITSVYWIHRKEHTDILTEGYVGVSINPDKRYEWHKANGNPMVARAFNKYDDIIMDIVYTFDDEDTAYARETELRPHYRIGWNIAPGGHHPPSLSNKGTAVAEKISKSIKALGTVPYCKNTHSPAAIAKREAKKKANKAQWWHDPITLEYKQIKTAFEDIPEGWERGRKPKIIVDKKIRGVDYDCHVAIWRITIDGEVLGKVTNLKAWCREQKIPYITGSVYHRTVAETKIYINKINGVIYEDDISTGLRPGEYAKHQNVSSSRVSGWINQGFRIEKEIQTIEVCKQDK